MVDTIAAFIFLVVVGTAGFFFIRWEIRCFRHGIPEVRDQYRVYRRGVLNPEQVRQEFVATMGREPTIEEVHDLHDLIESEHAQARNGLLAVGGGIVGLIFLFHRALHGKGI